MQANPLSPSLADEQITREYRVVQWATGTIGARALRAIIEHPHMTLAGVYVHGHDKVGRDAGDLCGVASTGVTATASIDEIVELGADCVLYMPNSLNLDELCRLLAAGINVVTTCGAFHHPASMDPELPREGAGGLRARRRLGAQHRQQPWFHHRGRPAGAHLDSTSAERT